MRPEPPSDTDRALFAAAAGAVNQAYAPYSGFPVGAALRAASGNVFTGCNVENASYGLTVCAERIALFAAVAAGERTLAAIAVASGEDGRNPVTPCGACRQVLSEFAPQLTVLRLDRDGRLIRDTLARLLPDAFGPPETGDRAE